MGCIRDSPCRKESGPREKPAGPEFAPRHPLRTTCAQSPARLENGLTCSKLLRIKALRKTARMTPRTYFRREDTRAGNCMSSKVKAYSMDAEDVNAERLTSVVHYDAP